MNIIQIELTVNLIDFKRNNLKFVVLNFQTKQFGKVIT
jgi:hypothetical protein